MEQHYVVVSDPSGEYWEGAIVNAAKVRQLASRGVEAVPCDPRKFAQGGAGYVSRRWGSGISVSHLHPVLVSPVAILVIAEDRYVHWLARVVPDPNFPKNQARGGGQLALASDPTQPHAQCGRISGVVSRPEPLENLRDDLQHLQESGGGWTIGGTCLLSATPGFVGLALRGAGLGFAVASLAISVTEWCP